MRRVTLAVLALAAVAVVAALAQGLAPSAGTASSHREAPLDLGRPDGGQHRPVRVPQPGSPGHGHDHLERHPGGGPGRRARCTTSSRRRPATTSTSTGTATAARRSRTASASARARGVAFLRNTVQPYTVTRIENGRSQVVASGNDAAEQHRPADDARTTGSSRRTPSGSSTGGGLVFAGQRDDAFFGDIGAIFDSLGFRRGTGNAGGGKDFFAGYGVHTISLQLPIASLADPDGIVGVWTSVDRQQIRVQTVTRKVRASASGARSSAVRGCRSPASATRSSTR